MLYINYTVKTYLHVERIMDLNLKLSKYSGHELCLPAKQNQNLVKNDEFSL